MKPFKKFLIVVSMLILSTGVQAKAKDGQAMKGAKIFVIHGYMATPESHWFNWLTAEVVKEGATLKVLKLPDSNNPKLQVWQQVLTKEIPSLDKNTYLIGHSLGCITTLKYLSELPASTRIGGFMCAAGFSEPLKNLPMLNEFTQKKYDVEKVKQIALRRVVLVSENDAIVEPAATKRLAKELDAPLISIEDGGHFLDSDGFKEFPKLLDQLKKMVHTK